MNAMNTMNATDIACLKSMLKEGEERVTHEDLAEAVGISRTVITKMINGIQPFTYERAVVFAKTLGKPRSVILRCTRLDEGTTPEPPRRPGVLDAEPWWNRDVRPGVIDAELMAEIIEQVLTLIHKKALGWAPAKTAKTMILMYADIFGRKKGKRLDVLVAGSLGKVIRMTDAPRRSKGRAHAKG